MWLFHLLIKLSCSIHWWVKDIKRQQHLPPTSHPPPPSPTPAALGIWCISSLRLSALYGVIFKDSNCTHCLAECLENTRYGIKILGGWMCYLLKKKILSSKMLYPKKNKIKNKFCKLLLHPCSSERTVLQHDLDWFLFKSSFPPKRYWEN